MSKLMAKKLIHKLLEEKHKTNEHFVKLNDNCFVMRDENSETYYSIKGGNKKLLC